MTEVSSDQRPESLAEQAAAWVPPWARSPEPQPEPAAEPEVTPQPESKLEVRPQPDSDRDVTPQPECQHPTPAAQPQSSPGSVPGARAVPEVEAAPGVEFGSAAEAAPPADPIPHAHASAEAKQATAKPSNGRRAGSAVPPAPLSDTELHGALEAILLVVDEPVSAAVLAQTLEQPTARITAALERIAAGYTQAGHGFELRRAAGGWRLYTRPEYARYVERYVLDGQSARLTQAALETLAVVAYKQPVTRSRVAAVRGVNCDGVIRTLVTRGLIEECGTEPSSGAFLYRTTTLFLEKLGLNSLNELPSLAPYIPSDVEEFADAP